MPSPELERRRSAVLARVLEHVEQRKLLLILKAPPGSGKTFTTLRAVALAQNQGGRIAIATQTNAQADDICRRFASSFPRFRVCRFAASDSLPLELGDSIQWVKSGKDLPSGPCIVVATSAKWAMSKLDESFDQLFIDEAWQLCWADFILLASVAPRFVLVGDPGQIAPVVPIDVSRWETSPRPPHKPAPEVILGDSSLDFSALALPVTTRLPHDTTALVRQFYDFEFQSWAEPGDRRLSLDSASGHPADRILNVLQSGSIGLAKLPTPESGPPQDDDRELAKAAASSIRRLLERRARFQTEDMPAAKVLEAEDIGVTASHRIMVSRLAEELAELAPRIRVDTAERWQGLERPIMVAIHPLSGLLRPSEFDLSTGRLCVMASRHKVGLLLFSRDHVGESLRGFVPAATQAVGQPDEAGQGHSRHWNLWQRLEQSGRSEIWK